MSIVKEYLALTVQWKKEYGDKTLVLMQVGSFFEVYALQASPNHTTKELIGSNIIEFANLNEMVISPKQCFVDEKQVMMAGFGLPQLDKYVKKLQENGYTIVIYRQDIQGKNTTRSLAEIISPGTFFSVGEDTTHISNNIMCIWLHTSITSKYFQKKTAKKTMTIGIANIDIYTGKTTLFQFELDSSFHNPSTYDELERYISIYRPSECLLVANLEDRVLNEIISFIGLDKNECRKIHKVNMVSQTEEMTKMQICAMNAEKQIYQNEIFKRFYPNVNPDFFATSLMIYFIAVQAFVFLLDFVYQHSPNLVNKLNTPVIENHTDKLILANHSLKQLNMIDDSQHTGKLRSVSSFLNNCATNMGKRLFMYHLHNPIANAQQLNASYSITAHLLKKEKVDWELQLRSSLLGIKDMEKLLRKLVLHKIAPKDFALLAQDLKLIAGLDDLTNKDDILMEYLQEKLETGNIKSACLTMITDLERVFDLEKCGEMNTTDFSVDDDISLFIRKGVDKRIDELMKANVDSREKMEAIRLYLSNLVKGVEKKASATTGATGANETQFLKIHETPKSLPVLLGTSKRVVTIESQIKKILLAKQTSIKLTYKSNYTKQEETFDFNISNLTYNTTVGSNKKDLVITSDEILKISKDMQTVKEKLVKEMSIFYNNYVSAFLNYQSLLDTVMRYTSELDLLQNKCYIAYKYNYCQPEIVSGASASTASATISATAIEKKSYMSFKKIRHPLIEHLQTNELYVTNDLAIGLEEEMDGLLLYGTNAVGKTSFIKSVGIALIMAQCGLFVPCESFIYRPYTCIFTRILGNDNIFKGLSTFAVEMSELRTILTQADENSLVLGDELCSGTESDSALSIFTAGLEMLHQKKSTFLFATHFHEIINYDEIKALKKLKMMHMAVHYNKETGVLMYDRRLRAGPGESMYGLEVCKSLNLPDDFLKRAHDIRMRYKPESRNILSLETSHYNAKKIVGGLCEVCSLSKSSEVHHLQPQKKASKKKNDYIETFHKNHLANLVNICEECHQKIHLIENKEHKIIKTSKGYELVSL
jgi:DNA mismatch repair protein MutS